MILRVVSGLAVRDGEILMGKRPPGKLRGGLWETPGGKVEPGESAVTALAREWKEELGISIAVGPLISVAMFDLEVMFAVELYAVDSLPSEFSRAQAIDHTEIAWVPPRDAAKFYPCSPAFYVHYPQIRQWMRVAHGAVL